MISSFKFIRRNPFSAIAIVVLLLASCLCITSCFGGKTPQRTYFSIDYTLGTQPKTATPKYEKTVVLENITTALAYDRQEIVYRANPYEFQYYWYRLWASKPKKMLRELILGHLKYTNLFTNVSSKIEDTMPDYFLNVDIISIEELDVSDKEWYAHLNLEFTLIRDSDKSAVWTYAFDARRAVADNQPVYVVKAMSELLDTELVKAFQDLDKTLQNKIPSSLSSASASAVDFDVPDSSNIQTSETQDMPRATLKNK